MIQFANQEINRRNFRNEVFFCVFIIQSNLVQNRYGKENIP